MIAGILAMGSQFVQVGAPQLLEAGRMVLFDDPGIPDYSVRLMRDGTEAEIAGSGRAVELVAQDGGPKPTPASNRKELFMQVSC
mgnify:CR=1 FL=1